MPKYLLLMLGYPGSGKSTVSKIIAAELGAIRLSSDEARQWMFTSNEEIANKKLNPYVFGALDYAASSILASGNSVVYDANNNRLRERYRKHNFAKRRGAKSIVVWVKTPLETAEKREKERAKDPDYPPIPKKRFIELVNALEEPAENEKSIEIDGSATADEQVKSFKLQLKKLN